MTRLQLIKKLIENNIEFTVDTTGSIRVYQSTTDFLYYIWIGGHGKKVVTIFRAKTQQELISNTEGTREDLGTDKGLKFLNLK